MTEGSSELLLALYEMQQRIDDIDVASRSCKGIRLRLVNEVELERMIVARLCCLGNSVRNGLQLIVQRRGLYDLALGLQLVEDLLAQLLFLVLILRRLILR